jgi:replication factor A1
MPIKGLSPYTNGRWRIKARILNKSDIRKFTNSRGEGQLFKVELADASGETSGTFFGRAVDTFYNILQEGKVYTFSRGAIKVGNPRWDRSEHVITFEERAQIEPVAEEDSSIPGVTYDFQPLSQVEAAAPGTIMDVASVVHSVGELQTFTSRNTGRELTKREVGLFDTSGPDGGCFVELTLWANRAADFKMEVGQAIFFKGARVSEFNGTKNLASPISYEANPDDQKAFALVQAFQAFKMRGGSAPTLRVGGGGAAGMRKTIEAMKEEDVGLGPPPAYGQVLDPSGPRSIHRHTVLAYVTNMPDRMPCYASCPEMVGEGEKQRPCSKKVTEDVPGTWRCNAGHVCQQPVYRYLCRLTVADSTEQVEVNIYDQVAPKLFGCDAAQAAQAWTMQPESLQQQVVFKKLALRVRSQREVWQEAERIKYSVDDFSIPSAAQEARKLLAEMKPVLAQLLPCS